MASVHGCLKCSSCKTVVKRLPAFNNQKVPVRQAFNMHTGAEFEVVEAPLETEMSEQYEAAAGMWNQLRREFLYAAEQAEDAERDAGLPKKRGSLLWRSFWASHQRFFRHMCMAAKVGIHPHPLFEGLIKMCL